MSRSSVPPALAACLVFLGAAVALLWPALGGEQVLSAAQSWAATGPFTSELRLRAPLEGRLQSDQGLQFAPWLRYAAEAWSTDGRLPLWKSTASCGAPLLGNAQSALLYPPHLLAIVLGFPDWAPAALALLKLAGGMLCAWLLARHLGLSWLAALLCGLAFGLGGFQAVWVMHPHTNVSFVFPLLILLADKVAQGGGGRVLAGLALVAGLQHLGGHPETAFHCQVAALGVGAARAWSLRSELGRRGAWRRLGGVAAGLGLGALLGAAQLLPVVEYIAHGDVLARRLEESASRSIEQPLPALAFVGCLVAGLLAVRALLRRENPLLAAAALCAAAAGGALAHMRISCDSAHLLPFAADWLGGPIDYLGPPNYVERNGAYAGAALALAAVGLLHGRPRGAALAAAAGVLAGLLAGFRAPLLIELLELVPGFHVAANLRLQLWALLGLAVLAGLGLDALGRPRVRRFERVRAPLLLGALGLGLWIALGAGARLGWSTLALDPTVPAADTVIKAELGPRGDLATFAPGLAEYVERIGLASVASAPQAVVGWVWLPSFTGGVRLEFAPGGATPALLAAHEELAPAGEVPGARAVRRYSFAAVVPRQALASGSVRACLVVTLADGRTAVSRTLTPSNDPSGERLPLPMRPAEGAGARQMLLLAAAAALAAWGLGTGGVLLAGLRAAIVVAVLATLLPFASALLPMLPPDLYYPRTAALEQLAALAPQGRIFTFSPGRFPREVPTWYGIRDVSGYDAIAPARVARLLRAAAGRPDGPAPIQDLPTRPDPDLRLLGLAGVKLLLDVPGTHTLLGTRANPAFLPRARLVTGVAVEPDDERALALLARPEFPRDTTVVLDSGAPSPALPQPGPPPRVSVDRPDRVVVAVEPAAPALLVLADTDFPGWTARVDGRLRPILRANVAFRAVEVQPGEREVEFRYEPLSVRAGLLLMLLGGAACAALLLGYRPRPNFWSR